MPRALIPLLAVTFVDILGFSILIPLLPFYAEHYGASPFVVGMLVSTVAIVTLFSSPILGALSDRLGRRGILIVTQIAATIAYMLLGIGGSLTMVFISRAIEGIGGGSLGVTQAYIGDVTAPENRARAFALLGATYGTGFILGPALGGALVRFGYAVPFFAAAAISLVTIVLTVTMLPESHKPLPTQVPLSETIRAVFEPKLRALLGIQLCFTLAFTMWVSILALFLERTVHFGPSQTSLFYAASGVISVIMQTLFVGRLVDALRERNVLILGLLCAGLAYAFVATANSVAAIIPLILLWSVGSSLTRPAISALISRAAAAEQRGALMGASDAVNNIGFIFGPLIATAVLMKSTHLVGVLPAVLVLTGALLALRLPAIEIEDASGVEVAS